MLAKLTRHARDVLEDYVVRPIFFLTVLPPLLVWDWWTQRREKLETDEEDPLYDLYPCDDVSLVKPLHTQRLEDEVKRFFGVEATPDMLAALGDARWVDACFACGERHPYWQCPQMKAITDMVEAGNPATFTPTNIHEAVVWMHAQLTPEQRSTFTDMPEEDLALAHHGWGRKLRNDLGLWEDPHPPLWHYFNSIHIRHPDDISGILMRSLHRYLNQKPINIEDQIKHYHAYWLANGGTLP